MPGRLYVLAVLALVVRASASNVIGKLWVWGTGGKSAEARAYETIVAGAEEEFARIDGDGDGAIGELDMAEYFTRVEGIDARVALDTAQAFMRVGRQC